MTFSKTKTLISTMILSGTSLFITAEAQASKGLLQITETAKTDYAKTKYPIVMVHGWLG